MDDEPEMVRCTNEFCEWAPAVPTHFHPEGHVVVQVSEEHLQRLKKMN